MILALEHFPLKIIKNQYSIVSVDLLKEMPKISYYLFFLTLFSSLAQKKPSSRQFYFLDSTKIYIKKLEITGKGKSRYSDEGLVFSKIYDNAVWRDGSSPNNIIFELNSKEGYVLAWEEQIEKKVMITFLDKEFKVKSNISVVNNCFLGGFCKLPNGYALGVLSEDKKKYELFTLDDNGKIKNKTLVIGDCSEDELGCKHSPMAFGSAKIAWDSIRQQIVLFMTHLMKSSDGVSHQAGLIKCFDSKGYINKDSKLANS
ncbi:MAG: hypothetical protein SNJ77_12955, partial [Cytophagales bacterium]